MDQIVLSMLFPVSHRLVDNIIFVQVSKIVFERFIDSNVTRLENACAAWGDKDQLNPWVRRSKPSDKALDSVGFKYVKQ